MAVTSLVRLGLVRQLSCVSKRVVEPVRTFVVSLDSVLEVSTVSTFDAETTHRVGADAL